MGTEHSTDDRFRFTVLGTTDTHGYILNWDYFTDAEYDDFAHNDVGLAKISTLITQVRSERAAGSTITIDAGDTIQGTPLAYYFAKPKGSEAGGSTAPTVPTVPAHPIATAMNAIGYDAAAVGNHEFNYGIAALRAFEAQLTHPLLGANIFDWQSGAPAFSQFVIRTVQPELLTQSDAEPTIGTHATEPLKVGIVGLVTPGCAIWDKAELAGRLRFGGIVEEAARVIPQVKAAGADVVIVACHSGADTSSSYGDALPWPENAATLLAQQVPDIDAILVGHAHAEIPQRFVTGPDGQKQVLLSEPLKWGMRLAVMDLDLSRDAGQGWRLTAATAELLDASSAAEDPTVRALVMRQHEETRTYVNGVIGRSMSVMSASTSRYQPSAAIQFINHVQAATVARALADTEFKNLPVLAIAAPYNADAAIPAGDVTIRHVAGLYAFDNTLQAVLLTGAQLATYLEFSARYFKQVRGSGPFAAAEITNAETESAPGGVPDYNFDIVGGLGVSAETSLSYVLDIAQPPGSRVSELTYGLVPVESSQRFVVAINNYRAAGGANFPAVGKAPVVYDEQREIRQLIIDWVSQTGTIDPTEFGGSSWRLVANGEPITIY